MYERIVSLYGKNVRSHLAIVYVYYVNASERYNVLLFDIILQYRTNVIYLNTNILTKVIPRFEPKETSY